MGRIIKWLSLRANRLKAQKWREVHESVDTKPSPIEYRTRHIGCAIVGVGLGARAAGSDISAGAAAAHCTRYGPNYAVDPANCSQQFGMGGLYTTGATALRDGNAITMSGSRDWSLWLEASGGGFPQNNTGTGFGWSQGGYAGYAYAGCSRSGAAVNGQCYTNWHD